MRKPGSPRDLPPKLELECLKILWILGEANVKQVRDSLAGNRPLAYTTVMTALDRLARRGGVERRKVGRSFVYVPALTRDCARRLALQELLDGFFDGSSTLLREYLDQDQPSPLTLSAATPSRSDDVRLDASLL